MFCSLFFCHCVPDFPLSCTALSLKELVNQKLHHTCATDIELLFQMHQQQSVINSDQAEGLIVSLSCHMFLSFFTTVSPKSPTSELESSATCQPKTGKIFWTASQIVWALVGMTLSKPCHFHLDAWEIAAARCFVKSIS